VNDEARTESTAAAASAGAAESLLTEVKVLALRLRQRSSAAAEAGGVPAGGLQVLHLLEQHGPQSVPALASRRSTSRQNIQILVNRLVKEGCVERADNPAHKRSALVQLSGRGRELLAAATLDEQALARALVAQVPEDELRTGLGLLEKVRNVLRQDGRRMAGGARGQGSVRRAAAAQKKEATPPPDAQATEPAQSSPEELPYNLL
jgi:DNA-binding MarR family transcriptional regulator